MWLLLCKEQLGIHFRRQHPMGAFILDFYAPQVRLAIELDGAIHNFADQKEFDLFRQRCLEEYLIEFIRFSNSEIDNNIMAVAAQIKTVIKKRNIQFDHKIKWISAADLQSGVPVFADGQRSLHFVKRIRNFNTVEEVFNLHVAEDNSYVTEMCSLRSCEV